MSFAGPGFILTIIAICTAGWVFTTWIRARHGYPIENEWGGTSQRQEPATERKIELLITENAALLGKITRLEERIAVLERIATDANSEAARIAHEIDRLR